MVDASVERQVLNCGNSPGFLASYWPRASRIFLGFAPMTLRSRRSISNQSGYSARRSDIGAIYKTKDVAAMWRDVAALAGRQMWFRLSGIA
ncbi:hypothetical protein D3C81_2030530 [compost metagenome]